ncbi:MAG: shikimate kinase [Cyanobacteria bacterium P01_D01_bin.44]
MTPNFLKGTNVYLVGMMGAGKSTVGKRLAEQLGYRFLDTDTVIEQTAGHPISQIFAEQGETVFRDLETQVLNQVSTYPRLVVATGGGMVIKPINWSYLQYGAVVWLDVPVVQLVTRLTGDASRPLLQTAEQTTEQTADLQTKLEDLLAQRHGRYAQADIRIAYEAGEGPDAIATRIITALKQIVKPPQKPVFGAD